MPQQNADATHPGGLGVLSPSTASAFFNVGFRHLEPGGANGFNPAAWWREAQQSSALQTGDLTQFHDDVDFGKLAAGVNDDMPGQPQGVPQSGPVDRILQSHFELQQGANFSQGCGGNDGCHGEYLGQLQPYNVYVPKSHTPGTRYGMTLLLHSLSVNYNQFYGSHNQSQFGDRGTGSLVLTAEGRGPDGWYVEYAGADVIEDWADVAAHYQIDPDWTAISGYSMGGYGTYRLGTLFPDLFAKGQPVVGPPGVGIWAPPAEATGGKASNTYYQLASMRNVPMLIWDAAEDQLVPTSGTETQARGFDGLGYRYEYDLFEGHGAGHFGLAVNDQYQPAADWLATTRVDRDPPHVTYVVNPKMSFPAIGIVADHAYWLSNIQLHDSSGTAPLGTIDVRSEGFGVADPAPSATMFGAGVLTGGTLGPMAYTSQAKTWGPAGAAPIADKLDISASNVSAVNVNVQRARVDCNVALNITSSTPLQVTLAGCNRAVSFTPALPNTAAGQLRTFTIRTLVIAAAALVLLLFSAALVAALLLSAAPRRP